MSYSDLIRVSSVQARFISLDYLVKPDNDIFGTISLLLLYYHFQELHHHQNHQPPNHQNHHQDDFHHNHHLLLYIHFHKFQKIPKIQTTTHIIIFTNTETIKSLIRVYVKGKVSINAIDVIINNCLYFSLFANTFKTVLENIKTKIISIIQRVGVSSGLSCKSEIILESHENAFSKSSKPHIIPSKYLLSLNNTKFFSQIFFVRISGKTHSTQYQVAIFHDLSSIAIRTTNQLSLSFFQTQISCQISVDTDDMSSPSVVGIITNNISAVYLSLIS